MKFFNSVNSKKGPDQMTWKEAVSGQNVPGDICSRLNDATWVHTWADKRSLGRKKKKAKSLHHFQTRHWYPKHSVSASLNTGEKGGWQNRFDSQFTCNISDSSTSGSCRAVFPPKLPGETRHRVRRRSGQRPAWAPHASLIDPSRTGCQSPQPRDTARQAAVICVY